MKAEYASHQLQGPINILWCHYRSTLPENAQITWNQFQDAFKGHYIPHGLMAMKHTEFMKLVQGTKNLTEFFMHSIIYQGMPQNLLIQMQRELLASREGLVPS